MKYRVKIDQHTYEVEVGDLNQRPVTAYVEGEKFEIWPEEALLPPALIRPSAPLPTAAPITPAHRPAAGSNAGITAPIPGTIVSVAVQPGQQVSPGQVVLVLEAMKMKNLIRASHAAQVIAVKVQPGERVSQGQRLVEFSS